MFARPIRHVLIAAAILSTNAIASHDAIAHQRGVASYYSHSFHGRQMANGERFSIHSDSAAHRHLPFGTRVRVTNLTNGRVAYVVIRDRGPFVHRRIIDLSPRTASDLDMRHRGLAPVRLEVIRFVEVAQAR